MSIRHYYLIFAIVLFSSLNASPVEPGIQDESGSPGEVVFVNVLYRHGDRTPVDPYPTDPYNDPKLWPVGWGQLTKLGMHQHFELGKWIRNHYKNLLVDDYTREDIYIQSTDVDRTLMSAMSNLAGMYPPTDKRKFDENMPWAPIPVHTVPEKQDNIVAMKKKCPRYEEELEEVRGQPELKRLSEKWQDVFAYITEHTGRVVNDIKHAEFIHNCLFIEETNNFTLPSWTKKVYPEPLREISAVSFTIPTFTSALARLKSGPLLGQMLENFYSKIKKETNPDRKMYIYSAHDTTVANLLNTLKVFTPSCPPYTAMVLMELWKKEDDYFVAISYKNSTEEPALLTLPGCTKYCPIAKFDSIVRPIIPDDWEKECRDESYSRHMTMVITALGLSFASLAVLVMLICIERTGCFRSSYFRIP